MSPKPVKPANKKPKPKEFDILVKTLFGFEDILARELKLIGCWDVQTLNRAVKCTGDKWLLYKINLCSRLGIKVLKPLSSFYVADEQDLYQKIKRVRWQKLMNIDTTFAIEGTVSGGVFTHSQYVALKSKDAIVDFFRAKFGERPSVDVEDPDIKINVHIAGNQCTVSLDSTGQPLHKRGYKLEQTEAPMSEVLAAGLLTLANWNPRQPLIDPMCGSGTLPIEAALMACNVPPGIMRNFAFQKWKDFDEKLWEKVQEKAENEITGFEGQIIASDDDREAVEIAMANAERAGVEDLVDFNQTDFFQTNPELSAGKVIMNPPYGERLEEESEMAHFYKKIGDHLKIAYDGFDAFILSGNIPALKAVGLKPKQRVKLFNGPIECRYNHFEMYRGTRRTVFKKSASSEEEE